MANLFWVGGSNAYDGVTNRFATTSGGAATVAAVVAADTVTFDANSPAAAVVTTTASISCATLTLNTGFTGSVTQGAAVTMTGAFTVTQGTYNTNGQNFTAQSMNSAGVLTRTISLGASAVSLTTSNTPMALVATGLTFNAGTSTISCSPFTNSFPNNTTTGLTFYNLVITGNGGRLTVGNTFNNITYTGASNKTSSILLVGGVGTLTINGVLTVNGNSVINRVLIGAVTRGALATISVPTLPTFSNVDFMDISSGGASAPWNLAGITGNSGDAGGNSGITFTTPATQTSTGTAGFSWSTHGWTTRVPLPQDNVSIPNSFVAAQVITADMPRLGKDITVTATGSPGWTQSVAGEFYGSIQMAIGMTIANANILTFAGRGSHTVTSNGVSWVNTPSWNTPTGTYTFQDAFTTPAALTLTQATLDTNSQTVTSSTFVCTGTLTRTLTLGSTTWNLTLTSAGTLWNTVTGGFTLNQGTSNIVISAASANARTFASGNKTYSSVTYVVPASTGSLSITGSSNYTTINVSGGTRSLLLTNTGTYSIMNLNVFGTAGNLVTVASTTPGSVATVTKPSGGPITITSDYLSVQDISVIQPLSFFAGANSTSVSGNTNVIITAPGTYRFTQSVAGTSAAGVSITATYLATTTAGNLLVAYYYSSGTTGTVTPPSGWLTAVGPITQTGVLYIFYKIATGAETTVTTAQVTNRTLFLTVSEYSGFTGTPTLDVTDSNSTTVSGTSLSTAGTAPSNTAQPALAFAMLGNPGTLGATVSLSNGFLEDRTVTNANTQNKAGVEELTSLAAVSTTFTWTTARANSAAGMAVFKNVALAGGGGIRITWKPPWSN